MTPGVKRERGANPTRLVSRGLVLTLIFAAVGLVGTVPVPNAEATSHCQRIGDHADSWIVIEVCAELVPETRAAPDFRLEPQTETVCPVGEPGCVPIPANVHQWIVINQQTVDVFDPRPDGTDVWLYPERIQDALCTPYPPACDDPDEIIEEIIDIIDDPEATYPASSDGTTIDGVVIEVDDGTSIYIGAKTFTL